MVKGPVLVYGDTFRSWKQFKASKDNVARLQGNVGAISCRIRISDLEPGSLHRRPSVHLETKSSS